MPDAAALYGLVGVVGGAAIGAWAAIYGPLRLHQKQAEQKAIDRLVGNAQEETARWLTLRTTGRAWLDALERTVQELEAQRPIDLDHFDEMIAKLSIDNTEVSYALEAIYGSATADLSQLIDRLRDATRIVRADILQQSQPQSNSALSQSYSALNDVKAARAQLNAVLLEKIEQINQRRAQRL